MKTYYIYILIGLLIYKCINIKEGFSGFHEVNTVIRYMRRCSHAIASFKNGIWYAVNIIIAKKSGDECKQHYECGDKCVCQNLESSTKSSTKTCTCIPN